MLHQEHPFPFLVWGRTDQGHRVLHEALYESVLRLESTRPREPTRGQVSTSSGIDLETK
jgi:hypothetical protein